MTLYARSFNVERRWYSARNFPRSGAGNAGIFEVVSDFDTNTFRAAYVVRFEKAVYVLHCFQKKSPRRVRTAKTDVNLNDRRLKSAKADYEVRYGKASQKG